MDGLKVILYLQKKKVKSNWKVLLKLEYSIQKEKIRA